MPVKITDKIDLMCPTGFYCMKDGKRKCPRLEYQNNRPYCAVYYPFLDTDKEGNPLKDDRCLLAEKQARMKE